MRGTVLLALYINLYNEKEGNLLIPRKRPTDLSLSLTMANKTIEGCVQTPCPDALFAGITTGSRTYFG